MKTCIFPGCHYNVFSHLYCRKHQNKRPDFIPTVLKRTPIKKVSTKQAKNNRLYSKERKIFLEEHPICELDVKGICIKISTEVHHTAGREGKKLTNFSKCKAACRPCHQFAELNPKEAKAEGYSSSRLSKDESKGKAEKGPK
jgi:5-methylcytosine-specific restriction protein A